MKNYIDIDGEHEKAESIRDYLVRYINESRLQKCSAVVNVALDKLPSDPELEAKGQKDAKKYIEEWEKAGADPTAIVLDSNNALNDFSAYIRDIKTAKTPEEQKAIDILKGLETKRYEALSDPYSRQGIRSKTTADAIMNWIKEEATVKGQSLKPYEDLQNEFMMQYNAKVLSVQAQCETITPPDATPTDSKNLLQIRKK